MRSRSFYIPCSDMEWFHIDIVICKGMYSGQEFRDTFSEEVTLKRSIWLPQKGEPLVQRPWGRNTLRGTEGRPCDCSIESPRGQITVVSSGARGLNFILKAAWSPWSTLGRNEIWCALCLWRWGLSRHYSLYPTSLVRQSIAMLGTAKLLWLAVADKCVVPSTSLNSEE